MIVGKRCAAGNEETDMNANMNAATLLGNRDVVRSVRSERFPLWLAFKGSAVVKGFIPPTELARVR
jgi:hypothetical protein